MACLLAVPDEARVVVITGAASGMGAATARLFASEPARVVIVDQDARAAGLVAAPIGAIVIDGDVTDSGFCDHVTASVRERYGRLDVLVNAAGVIIRADAPSTADDAWRRVLAVNLDGTFFMCRAAIRTMRSSGGGVIVNFGSMWGSVGGRGHAAYCASKGAVHNLTRALALDHAREGIRVNAVCPGEVDTPMLRRGGRAAPLDQAQLARIAETMPLGRLAQPEEVARAVVFLASDSASYITGSLLSVDAGFTAA